MTDRKLKTIDAQDVKRQDIMVCPRDGEREHVVGSRHNGSTHFIRTKRHDHVLSPKTRVEVVER